MNRVQRRILGVLRDDPGISFRSLAAKVDLPASTAFDHVQAMREVGLLDYGKCPSCGRGILIVLEGDSDGSVC